jgi:hypothetical protein
MSLRLVFQARARIDGHYDKVHPYRMFIVINMDTRRKPHSEILAPKADSNHTRWSTPGATAIAKYPVLCLGQSQGALVPITQVQAMYLCSSGNSEYT